MFPALRICLAVVACLAASLLAGGSNATHEDGPRVAIRLVVLNSYGEGMGRCSVEVKSSFASQRFVVRDSGVAMMRVFPGRWHVSRVQCPTAWAAYHEDHARFDIPDSAADLTLGSLRVEFPVEEMFEERAAAKARAQVVAGVGATVLGGTIAGLSAAEYIANSPGFKRVEVEAILLSRANDRSFVADVATVLGHPDARRIPLRIRRID